MRIRSMSAGRAGASIYNANVNGEQGGGNKKQGPAPTTNKRVSFVLRAIKRELILIAINVEWYTALIS